MNHGGPHGASEAELGPGAGMCVAADRRWDAARAWLEVKQRLVVDVFEVRAAPG